MATSNPKIPQVRDGKLYRHDGELICGVGSRTGWHDWLADPRNKSFAFTAASGAHCTAVKERRSGSSGHTHFYWFAYRSVGGKKKRVSLGKSGALSLQKLERAAFKLAQLELMPV